MNSFSEVFYMFPFLKSILLEVSDVTISLVIPGCASNKKPHLLNLLAPDYLASGIFPTSIAAGKKFIRHKKLLVAL